MAVLEADAFLGENVEVGSLKLALLVPSTDVTPALIVAVDEDDVWLFCRG